MSNDGEVSPHLRSSLYNLLAALYLTPPTEETRSFAATLRDAGGEAGLPDEILHPLAALSEEKDEERLSAIVQDYHDLFVVPLKKKYIPPYENAHVRDRTMEREQQQSILVRTIHDVKEWYNKAGFVIPPQHPQQVDHIGLELAFMHALTQEEAVASEAGDEERVRASEQFQREFLSAHLSRWSSALAGRVAEQASTDFYRSAARLTAAFCAEDARMLRE